MPMKRRRTKEDTLTPEQVDELRAEYPGTIEFGSAEHRALLGIDDESLSPQRVSELERALNARPIIQAKKKTVNRQNFGHMEEITDGWYRQTK